MLCNHFVHISVRPLEAYGYRRNMAVSPEIVGAVSDSVAYSTNKTSETMKKNILGKMAELFEERLCKWYGITDM